MVAIRDHILLDLDELARCTLMSRLVIEYIFPSDIIMITTFMVKVSNLMPNIF